MAANKSNNDQQYRQTHQSVFPTRFEPDSLVDRLLKQGWKEGWKEGWQEGQEEGRQFAISMIQLLQRLLGEDSMQPDQFQSWSFESLKQRIEQLQQRLAAKSN